MKFSPIPAIALALFSFSFSGCNMHQETYDKIVATSPQARSITITQEYVCQIRSHRHVKIRTSERGALEVIPVKEGQQVKEGDVIFNFIPILYQAKLDAEKAEVQFAQLQLDKTKKQFEDKVVSANEVALGNAKLVKAQAQLAAAELNYTTVKAPFDGVVGRMLHQQGSIIEKGEVLTTLSDNSILWVYFNVPEARYLEYMADLNQNSEDLQIELVLANGTKFEQAGKFGAIGADFSNETGSISFRVDFPNPDRVLRQGQTGNMLISKVVKDAIVIPQRAVFELIHKQYVYVVDKNNVAHQREIEIQKELDDLFVIKSGIGVDDKIVLEGGEKLRDGDKVQYEEYQPKQVIAKLKSHAE